MKMGRWSFFAAMDVDGALTTHGVRKIQKVLIGLDHGKHSQKAVAIKKSTEPCRAIQGNKFGPLCGVPGD